MANIAKKAIVRALLDGALTDLMIKTTGEQVYLDDSTTLSAKLAELITSLNEKAKKTDVTTEITTAINNLIAGAPDTYDTLKEITDYIASHEDVADGLNSAIGNKLDKSTFEAFKGAVSALGALAGKSTVSETDLDAALKEKVNAAAEGNHTHGNKAALDGITSEKVTAWDGKSKVYYAATQLAELTANDLWVQLVE